MFTQNSDKTEIREVYGITDEEKEKIYNFLQGAVYCWCKNRKDEWFALRDLLGGDNFYWGGTPLYVLYDKSQDIKQAGKDAGCMLKKVIHDDKRYFDTKAGERPRQYRWNGEELLLG